MFASGVGSTSCHGHYIANPPALSTQRQGGFFYALRPQKRGFCVLGTPCARARARVNPYFVGVGGRFFHSRHSALPWGGGRSPLPPSPMPPVSLERSFAACGLRPAGRRWTTASAARLTAIPSPGGRSRNHRGDCSSAARGYSESRQQGASGCICRRAGKSPPASMPPCFWLRSLIGCGLAAVPGSGYGCAAPGAACLLPG